MGFITYRRVREIRHYCYFRLESRKNIFGPNTRHNIVIRVRPDQPRRFEKEKAGKYQFGIRRFVISLVMFPSSTG